MNAVTLRTWSGQYLCAEPGGRVVGDRPAAGPWETWTVESENAFRSHHGFFLCAEPSGRVVADRPTAGPWEAFHRVPINDGVALQTSHGTYVSVEPDGRVVADRTVIGPWEIFVIESAPTADEPATHQIPSSPVPGPSAGSPDEGGAWTTAGDMTVRPRISAAEIRGFVPARGPFRFPPPWKTQGVRLTNETDGMVRPIGMSYWPVINAHAGHDDMLVCLSLDDTLTLFSVDKRTLSVEVVGPLPFHCTGEGCYWSLMEPHVLYVPQGNRLVRYDVVRRVDEIAFQAPSDIWQCHSSHDGRVHSMRLEGGAAVYRDGRFSRFTPLDAFDECQIDKSGRWLVSKEGADNRIIDLETSVELFLRCGTGAVGHSDLGFGYIVGEDANTPGIEAGAFRLWRFTPNGLTDGRTVYRMHGWGGDRGMTRYVSHCSARQAAPDDQVVLFSSAHEQDLPRANEHVAATLDGSQRCVAICPNLTDLQAAGGGEDYWKKPRACLDPTGEWAAWTANAGTDRLDAWMVRIPLRE